MSQVHYVDSPMTLEDLTHEADLIVEVEKKSIGTIEVEKIVFPKSTHYKKSEETTYKKVATIFKVIQKVKSNQKADKFFKDQKVEVVYDEAYDKQMVQDYHEKGISKSPVYQQYASKFESEANDKSFIYFLVKSNEPKNYFRFIGQEGVKVLKDKKFQELIKK